MTKKAGPYRVGQVLDRYLSRADIYPKILEQTVVTCWEQAVGGAIAEATEAVRVRNRILQVKVTHPVWVQELQFHKAPIIQKINRLLGVPTVQELWFFVGEKEAATRSGETEKEGGLPRGGELTREEEARIEKEVSRVRDPEVKRVLSRLFSRALSLEKARHDR